MIQPHYHTEIEHNNFAVFSNNPSSLLKNVRFFLEKLKPPKFFRLLRNLEHKLGNGFKQQSFMMQNITDNIFQLFVFLCDFI